MFSRFYHCDISLFVIFTVLNVVYGMLGCQSVTVIICVKTVCVREEKWLKIT